VQIFVAVALAMASAVSFAAAAVLQHKEASTDMTGRMGLVN
jgi:hypothetical protein